MTPPKPPQPKLKSGQIWRDLNSRVQPPRYVRIMKTDLQNAWYDVVSIRTVAKQSDGSWGATASGRHSISRADRFDGNVGGFAFVEDDKRNVMFWRWENGRIKPSADALADMVTIKDDTR